MKFKGFKIRSMASAINQRQGSSGVRLGLGVQNEPLKQQVESPLFSERSRRVQTEERVGKLQRVHKRIKDALENQPHVLCFFKFDEYATHTSGT